MLEPHLGYTMPPPLAIMSVQCLLLDRHILRAGQAGISYMDWHKENTDTSTAARNIDGPDYGNLRCPTFGNPVTPTERQALQSPGTYESGELQAIFEARARLVASPTEW